MCRCWRQYSEKLEARLERMEEENAELRKRLEAAEREGKRQAAPFSRGKPKEDPKKPGRRPGARYGKHHCRELPASVDEIIDAPVTEPCCPFCGGELVEEGVQPQFVTDIPPVKPKVTRIDVHVRRCKRCGRKVRGRRPEQISQAVGAACNQIGPRAIALAAELNKCAGVSYQKIACFFEQAFGMTVSRATLARALLRTAEKAEPLYERVEILVRTSGLCCPDETGWKVGGRSQWLWAFPAPVVRATLYVIAASRGYDVIERALGAAYDGFLVRDGFSPYDKLECATHQICLRHIIVRCGRLEELNSGGAVLFPRELKQLLTEAIELGHMRDEGRIGPRKFCDRRAEIEWAFDELITKKFSNDENRKLAAHLIQHREHVFTFLYHPGVPATNYYGEQAIRPAVVNRKMSGGGNRTERGARAQAILLTVLRTASQRGMDPVGLLVELLRAPDSRRFAAMALGP